MHYEIVRGSIVGDQNTAHDRRRSHEHKKGNEDFYFVDAHNGIYILADGLGGHKAGKTAAEQATLYAARLLQEFKLDIDLGRYTSIQKTLEEVMRMCNKRIKDLGAARLEYAGMATTLDVMLIHNDVAHISHIGDASVYHWNGRKLTLLTEAHEIGETRQSEALTKAARILHGAGITHAIGLEDQLSPQYVEHIMLPGDCVFMATDGVAEFLTAREIAASLQSFPDVRTPLWNLVRKPQAVARAYARIHGCDVQEAQRDIGGYDNATFICVRRIPCP